jgi:hypothetical protein
MASIFEYIFEYGLPYSNTWIHIRIWSFPSASPLSKIKIFEYIFEYGSSIFEYIFEYEAIGIQILKAETVYSNIMLIWIVFELPFAVYKRGF